MILGIGVDLIEVGRIQASYERFQERFLNRILLPGEIAYCLSTKFPGHFSPRALRQKKLYPKPSGPALAPSWAGTISR